MALPIAEILAREPPTIAGCWESHRHAAAAWKPKPPPPPPKPSKPSEPQWAWDGDGWVVAPAAQVYVAAPQPSSWAVWMFRQRMAYGAIHTLAFAALMLTVWILSSFPRTLVVAGLIWILWMIL